MKALSRREEAFVEARVAGKNLTEAAIEAGYAAGSAASRGSRLASRGKVIEAIKLRREVAVAKRRRPRAIADGNGRIVLRSCSLLCVSFSGTLLSRFGVLSGLIREPPFVGRDLTPPARARLLAHF